MLLIRCETIRTTKVEAYICDLLNECITNQIWKVQRGIKEVSNADDGSLFQKCAFLT